MFYDIYKDSPVGRLLLLSDGKNLTGVQMEGQRCSHIEKNWEQYKNLPIFLQVKEWLDDYWKGNNPDIAKLQLKMCGSAFQQKVWSILQTIPYGQCTTYGAIAKRISQTSEKTRMSAQAVGGAIGHNPICIIVPCHRVVGAHGNLTGYVGGIDKKVILLRHEGLDVTKFSWPKKTLLNHD